MKAHWYLGALVLLIGGSCSNETVLEVVDREASTRTVVISSSNPNLIDDWENTSSIMLNSGTSVTAPWVSGTSSSLPYNFRYDIKKEDGWKMVFHTFKGVGEDFKKNYMLLYNQFTGVVKVFYYYEGGQVQQGTQWMVATSNGIKVHFLDAPEYFSYPSSTSAPNNQIQISNESSSPLTGLQVGWNGFAFEVPYSTDYASQELTIGAYSRLGANLTMTGTSELTSDGTVSSITTSKSNPNWTEGVAKLAGPVAETWVKKLPNLVNLGSSISSLISNIPTSGFNNAIKNGLNKIFGKTTTTTTNSDVHLTTFGKIKLGGQISATLTSGIPSLSFNLYQAMNATTTGTNSTLVAPSISTTGHYLGLWGLTSAPSVTRARSQSATILSSNSTSVTVGTYYPLMYSTVNTVVNPDVSSYLTSSSYDVEYLVCSKSSGNAYKADVTEIYDGYGSDLLYSDDYLILRKAAPGRMIQVRYNEPKLGSFIYDWGTATGNGRLLALITYHFTFNYNGKITQVDQSRVYEVGNYVISDADFNPDVINQSGSAKVLNASNSTLLAP